MLKVCIHFFGDFHQPLHASNRVTPEHPSGDRGGNDFPIKYGKITKLHSLWDQAIGQIQQTPYPLTQDFVN